MSKCLQAAPMTLIVYDWFLMLGDEVDLIWKRPTKTNVILYTAIRYLPIALVLVRIPSFALPVPPHFFAIYIMSMLGIMAFVQVLLQIRVYAMYHKSKIVLWTNAGLFAVEYGILILIVIRYSSNELRPANYAEPFVAPLCYELYLTVLALRKSWVNREASRQLGASNMLDILARGSGIYFIILVCGMALSMILCLVKPDYTGWLDMLAIAKYSIGGTRLILSVQKAFVDKMDEGTQYSAEVTPALTCPQFGSFTERGIHSEV